MNERKKTLEKGILDDLSFEDLMSAYENEDGEGKKPRRQEIIEREQVEVIQRNQEPKCRFNEYKPCNGQCQYYLTCTRRAAEYTKWDGIEIKSDVFSFYDEYFGWLRKERFLERVISLYKMYAAEDEKLPLIKDESEVLSYLNNCVKEYTGQKRNFYKYYLQFRRQTRR